jgi:hypothetical protein
VASVTEEEGIAVKRFVGVVVALILLPAGTATAQQGAPDLDVNENPGLVKVHGPGFKVKLTKHDLTSQIDDDRFGIPEAGFDIVREDSDLGPIGQLLRPFVCENGTYRVVSGIFSTTERASATALRPLPYPPAFGNQFPDIITFVGTLDAVVTNAAGEQFRLMMSDLAHEVMTPTSFSSTAPIHAFIVDSEGNVRDHASLVGRVNIDRTTGDAVHSIVDEGTCHQTATLLGQPGVTVFGPFFVLPFPTTVITP